MAKAAFFVALFSMTFALAAKAGQPVEIPFHFTDGFISIEARIAQSAEPLNLLLDSGASTSVLSLRTARRLHLPLGKVETVQGVGVEAAAYHLKGVKATANGAALTGIALAVDLSSADELCSRPVDGLIGVGFFQNRVVQIDYTNHLLRLISSSEATGTERLPIKLLNGIMCVQVGVNDSTARWTRLDTGCNDALHWVVPRPGHHTDHGAESIGFVTDPTDSTLTSVTLGKHTLQTVKTALHGQPLFPGEAGLLGNGVLSQFKVTVDWPHHQVHLADAPR